MFTKRTVGKTLVNRTQGMKNSEDSLKGRVFELSLGDLNHESEELCHRKFKLRIDDIQGRNCLTNFHGMDFTADKVRSMVKKWQSLIEGHIDVKTADGYFLRLFCIAFTKRRQNQLKRTSYAQTAQIRQIRKKMFEIITREVTSSELKDVVSKLIPDSISKEIEKQGSAIFPLHNVAIRKVKLLKSPKFDVQKLHELHSHSGSASTSDETGMKVERSTAKWEEPKPLTKV
jgi:small subunit ribosomal protein S3Ae